MLIPGLEILVHIYEWVLAGVLDAFQWICHLPKYWKNYLARIHISFVLWHEKVANLVAKHRKKVYQLAIM